jgi:hypothetical protein
MNLTSCFNDKFSTKRLVLNVTEQDIPTLIIAIIKMETEKLN